MNDLEVRLDLLYKVTVTSWDSPCYVAARSPQQAIVKIIESGLLKSFPIKQYDNVKIEYFNQVIV